MTDREKLIALIKEGECGALALEDCSYCKYDGEDDCSYQLLADVLLANGVVVREKGEWRNNKDDYPECDKCGYMPQYDPMIDDIYYSDFCPNCGADMRNGENG